MTDFADFAQVLEERERDAGIASVRGIVRSDAQRSSGRACVACGDPIEDERLKAAPGAGRCVCCQERLERHRRLYPGGSRA